MAWGVAKTTSWKSYGTQGTDCTQRRCTVRAAHIKEAIVDTAGGVLAPCTAWFVFTSPCGSTVSTSPAPSQPTRPSTRLLCISASPSPSSDSAKHLSCHVWLISSSGSRHSSTRRSLSLPSSSAFHWERSRAPRTTQLGNMRSLGPAVLACAALQSFVILAAPPPVPHRARQIMAIEEQSNAVPNAVPNAIESPGQATVTAVVIPSSASAPPFPPGSLATDPLATEPWATDPSLASPIPTASTEQSPSASAHPTADDSERRQLIIILAASLGPAGALLIGVLVYLIIRYRRRQSPLRKHRGATPIDDDEIDSWRRAGRSAKITVPPPTLQPQTPMVGDMQLKGPAWTWTASSTSIRTMTPTSSDSPVLAHAPNARIGLTNEAVPGADAFIAPAKRQSSRLSRSPPGLVRSESRLSSFSGGSLWSPDWVFSDYKQPEPASTWCAVDETAAGDQPGTEQVSSVDGITNCEEVTGSLSPRPAPRTPPWGHVVPSEEIGRAIS